MTATFLFSRRTGTAALLLALALFGGCATKAPPYDYTAFMKARPATLLVMPPINESPEVNATPGVWSHATLPLSEAGYYVLPITLVDETFRQNGVINAHDAQDIPLTKLQEFFGADAAVYMTIKSYGTRYNVLSSETRVAVEARIIDLRSGELLWQGKAVASSAEENQQSQGGLLGLLVTAVVKQIIGSSTDASYRFAGIANQRMLGAPRYNGVLPGPRSPDYGKASPTPTP
jgi:hypothetical protein